MKAKCGVLLTAFVVLSCGAADAVSGAADDLTGAICGWREPRLAASQPGPDECMVVRRRSGNVSVIDWAGSSAPDACDMHDSDCTIIAEGELAWIAAPVPNGTRSDHEYSIHSNGECHCK